MAGNSVNVAEMEEAAALMADAGLTVVAVKDWRTRGRSADLYPWALIAHHTAATNDITQMLCDGRSDLPGPLCNFELREYGDWGLIASGRANHAGQATITNSESYGIEATGPQSGYGPSAFPNNYDSYELGAACILAAMGAQVSDLRGHKEICEPPGRKIDPSFDMPAFRAGVSEANLEGDDFVPWSNWSNKDKQAMLDDFWRMLSRGEKVDGTKPSQIVDGSVGKVREWQGIFYDGDGADVPAGSDTHPNNFKVLRQKLDDLTERLEQAGVIPAQVDRSVG